MFSKKATKIDEIFIVDLTVTTYCQIDREDFVNFFGLLRKPELYHNPILHNGLCQYCPTSINIEFLCPYKNLKMSLYTLLKK
jgi:hypothetical protein